MFLTEPSPTPLDVRFRLVGTPIRVHPTFWLFSALLGWYFCEQLGWGFLALWVGWLFFSVLVHEFGHIILGRMFGQPGRIILYSLGGLAIGEYQRVQRWQRIVIFLAGPAAGFLLFGLVCLVQTYCLPLIPLQFYIENPSLREVITQSPQMLWFMTLVLNLLNLIPIFPLDGGQVSREVFSGIFPRHGLRLSLALSFLLAGGGAVYSYLAWKNNLPYPRINAVIAAMFLGLMALENFFMFWQSGPENEPPDADAHDWDRYYR